MRSVQSQQPREMRINTEPLRRQDTKNVRMRHQQHIVSSVEQRFDRGDRLTCARRSFLHRLTRTVVHGHLLAVRQSFNPIAFQRFGKCLRTVAPHIPSETAHRTHFLARTPFGTAVIPFRDFRSTSKSPYPASCAVCWALRNGLANMHPLRETLGKRLTQPFAGGTSLIAANVSQRNIGAAGVLSGFAPHGLPVTQQHQAARGDYGSGIASQLSFSHVSTLADASCVFIPFRHVSRTYSGMFSDALHWFHE